MNATFNFASFVTKTLAALLVPDAYRIPAQVAESRAMRGRLGDPEDAPKGIPRPRKVTKQPKAVRAVATAFGSIVFSQFSCASASGSNPKASKRIPSATW
jgi:hypothetical protein